MRYFINIGIVFVSVTGSITKHVQRLKSAKIVYTGALIRCVKNKFWVKPVKTSEKDNTMNTIFQDLFTKTFEFQ